MVVAPEPQSRTRCADRCRTNTSWRRGPGAAAWQASGGPSAEGAERRGRGVGSQHRRDPARGRACTGAWTLIRHQQVVGSVRPGKASGMETFNPRHRGIIYLLVGAAVTAFIAVNTLNALRKGGDATDYFSGGSRALHGTALYEGSGPAQGFIGPPFQALFFAPFAAVAERSQPAGRLLWLSVNLAFLAAGILSWYFACSTAMARWPLPEGRRVLNVVAAVAAILLPLQTNFEHQNMNALLLGVLGLGTWSLVAGRPHAAGLFLGFAAALKVFPALVIVYLAARRQWKALISASVTTVLLTLLPLLISGPSGFVAQVQTGRDQLGGVACSIQQPVVDRST